MPMRVGEMMVIVRAEDFASRTLRRVGGELAGLSRAQLMAAKREQVMMQMSSARHQHAMAEMNARRLQYVREGMTHRASLLEQQKAMRALADTQSRVMKKGKFIKGIDRGEIRSFQNAAAEVRRLGLQGAMAAQRLRAVNDAIAKRQVRTGKGPTIVQARELANAQRALKALGVEGLASAARFDQLNRSVRNFDQNLSRMPGMFQRAARGGFAMGEATSRVNRELQAAYNNLSRAQRNMLAFNNAMANMPLQRMADVGHALSGIGRTMQLIGLIGTGVLAAASNSFASFNREVMLAATQSVNISAGFKQVQINAAAMTDEITRLMMEFPATADEMAASAYDIFSSMDISFGGGMDLLRKFNQLSVATLTDLETATNAGITVLNNFGGSSKNINEQLNLMVATVRFGRMRLSDFNEMLNKVAPAAANAGQSLGDVAGAMALITTRQPSQAMSATGIARLLQIFQDPEFQQGVRAASKGMVDIVDAGGQLKPLPTVINDLARGFKSLATTKGAAVLFQQLTAIGRGSGRGRTERIEAQRAWTFLFKNLSAYNKLQFKTTNDAKEFARSLKIMSESPGVRWQVFVNQMRVLVLLIGEKAIPVFLEIGDVIQKAVRWLKSMDEATRASIIRFATWISVGTLLAGVILGIAGPIVAMIAHFKMWKGASAAAEAKTLTFAAALKRIPFIAFGLLLTQLIGIQRTIVIMTLAWAGWKAAAIAAAAASKIAMVGAATAVKIAWRSALIGTGVGALAIAFGFAAEYVITHWEKVKEWFYKFWDWIRKESFEAAMFVLDAFSHLPKGLGQWARDAKASLEANLGDIRMSAHLREGMKEAEKQMERMWKVQPKKFLAARKELNRQLKQNDIPVGVSRESVQKSLKAMNDFYRKMKEKQAAAGAGGEDFSKTFWKTMGKDFSEMVDKMYGSQLESVDNFKNWRNELAQVTKDASTQAVDNLRSMYEGLQQVNQDAFGELFQGPWLTSETFDIAKEWGITPRLQDMIRDLHEQNQKFEQWRASLDKLFKRGLPREMINDLRQMGPEEGQALIDEILTGKPGQVQKLIAEWKRKNKQIKAATKMDFTQEINQFKKAGGDMGEAIINGFQNAGVGPWFDNWVKQKFPNVIDAAVNQAIADWKAQNPRPKVTPQQQKQLPQHAQPGQGARPNTTNTDKSKTLNQTINMGSPDTRETQREADARKAAFIMMNAARNVFL